MTLLNTPFSSLRKGLRFLSLMAAAQLCANAAISAPNYADWADLALAAPAVVDADLTRVSRLSHSQAPDVPEGKMRLLVEGRLNAALKAPSVLPLRAEWLWQGPAAPRHQIEFQRSDRMLIFVEPIPGSSKAGIQQYRLVSANGQQPWSPEAEKVVRAILQEAAQPENRGLMVTGVTDAHVTYGTIEGIRQSQFFLSTIGNRPITLVVERAPDAPPARITATASEFISNAATVKPETLLWHALACGLPEDLPEKLAEDSALSEDYAAARADIGICERRFD